MRLNICVFGTEKLTRTLTGNFFNYINALTTAVVALAGITLGIFVCEQATHCSHNCRRNDVFTCDKFKVSTLSFKLVCHCVTDCGIVLVEVIKSSDICFFTHCYIPLIFLF